MHIIHIYIYIWYHIITEIKPNNRCASRIYVRVYSFEFFFHSKDYLFFSEPPPPPQRRRIKNAMRAVYSRQTPIRVLGKLGETSERKPKENENKYIRIVIERFDNCFRRPVDRRPRLDTQMETCRSPVFIVTCDALYTSLTAVATTFLVLLAVLIDYIYQVGQRK